jgi:DNA-binding transcriptional regulator GbsR (MarR family)
MPIYITDKIFNRVEKDIHNLEAKEKAIERMEKEITELSKNTTRQEGVRRYYERELHKLERTKKGWVKKAHAQ